MQAAKPTKGGYPSGAIVRSGKGFRLARCVLLGRLMEKKAGNLAGELLQLKESELFFPFILFPVEVQRHAVFKTGHDLMGSVKKQRRKKIAKHKRRKQLKSMRHKSK